MRCRWSRGQRAFQSGAGGGAGAADAAVAAESPGPARHRSPAGNPPAASTVACVFRPRSWAEKQRGRRVLSPRSSSSVARLGRAAFPQGPPRWGEVSVTSLLGLRGPARAVVAARAPGTRSPSGGRRPSELCVSSRRGRRAPAPKGRHTRTPPTGQPPFGSQLRLQRPLPPRSAPRTHCFLFPLGRPVLPGVRRFSWKRRCR